MITNTYIPIDICIEILEGLIPMKSHKFSPKIKLSYIIHSMHVNEKKIELNCQIEIRTKA